MFVCTKRTKYFNHTVWFLILNNSFTILISLIINPFLFKLFLKIIIYLYFCVRGIFAFCNMRYNMLFERNISLLKVTVFLAFIITCVVSNCFFIYKYRLFQILSTNNLKFKKKSNKIIVMFNPFYFYFILVLYFFFFNFRNKSIH